MTFFSIIHFYSLFCILLLHLVYYYFVYYFIPYFNSLFHPAFYYFIHSFHSPRHSVFSPALHSISYDFIHNCTLSTYILRFHSWFPSPFRFIFYVIHFYIYSPFLLFIPSARRSCMAKSLHKPYISRCYSLGQGLPS